MPLHIRDLNCNISDCFPPPKIKRSFRNVYYDVLSWVQTTRARARTRARGCGSFVSGRAHEPRYKRTSHTSHGLVWFRLFSVSTNPSTSTSASTNTSPRASSLDPPLYVSHCTVKELKQTTAPSVHIICNSVFTNRMMLVCIFTSTLVLSIPCTLTCAGILITLECALEGCESSNVLITMTRENAQFALQKRENR